MKDLLTNVLVTGASGALGRAVIAHMKKLGGYRIIAAGRRQCIDAWSTIPCDVRHKDQLAAAIEYAKPDLVLHLAATFSGDLSQAYAVNVEPARHILDLVQCNGRKTRVVLIGSASEYGVIQPEENPVREDRVLDPVSPYGVSKAWQTQLMGLYAYLGVDVLCARVFNLYGPGLSDRLFAGHLQNQIDEVVAGKRDVIEVGSLAATRDYISTNGASEQLLTIAAHGELGRIYHVASGVPITIREFMRLQLEAHGLESTIVREVPNLSNHYRYDVPIIYADITNTRRLDKTAGGGG